MKLPVAGSYCTDQLTTFCVRNFETAASKIQQAGANASWTFFSLCCPGMWWMWPSVCVLVLVLWVFWGLVWFKLLCGVVLAFCPIDFCLIVFCLLAFLFYRVCLFCAFLLFLLLMLLLLLRFFEFLLLLLFFVSCCCCCCILLMVMYFVVVFVVVIVVDCCCCCC